MLSFHEFHMSVIAVVTAAVAGLVRGFSGFGSALVYVPVMTALYGLQTAITTMVLIDVVAGLWIAIEARHDAILSEVAILFGAAIAGIPVGIAVLVYADPVSARWVMSSLVFAAVLVVALTRWRYEGAPNKLSMGAAGLAAGVFGTAFQMDGPPAVILWLGSDRARETVRGNTAVFLVCTGLLITATYASKGWISREIVVLAFCLFWPFLVGAIVGSLRFRQVSEKMYQWTAYGLMLLAAIAGLPLFDAWFR